MYLLMDVGGTEIKCGLISETGRVHSSDDYFPSGAGGSKEEVFQNFADILERMEGKACGETITGVGMAFPGPFDYEQGISKMTGLGKFDAIFGCPIGEELKKRRPSLEKSQFLFLHDIEAFAIGESAIGKAREHNKILCVCIGTGAGSAFVEAGEVRKKAGGGVPENGWIYNTPFRESIIDDYLSVRGLAEISKQTTGRRQTGKELYEGCLLGEEKALQVYRQFGEHIALALQPFLQAFCPDAIVIGGQIGKSFAYFGGQLEAACLERRIAVYQEEETSLLAMHGLYTKMRRERSLC